MFLHKLSKTMVEVNEMKYKKGFLIGLCICSWLTLPLLGKRALLKFLPASILVSLLVKLEFIIARKRKWFWFYQTKKFDGLHPIYCGPFLLGSMWFLKLGNGHFVRFMFMNAIMDALYAFPGVVLFRNWRVANLIRMKRPQFLALLLSNAVLLYVFQSLLEKGFNKLRIR